MAYRKLNIVSGQPLKHIKQSIVFIGVGAATVAFEFLLFSGLLQLNFNTYVVVILSYVVPGAFNYYAHCLLTFNQRPSLNNATRYVASAFFIGFLHVVVFTLAHEIIHMIPLYAKAVAMVISIATNFLVQKYFTFGVSRKRK